MAAESVFPGLKENAADERRRSRRSRPCEELSARAGGSTLYEQRVGPFGPMKVVPRKIPSFLFEKGRFFAARTQRSHQNSKEVPHAQRNAQDL